MQPYKKNDYDEISDLVYLLCKVSFRHISNLSTKNEKREI